MNPLSILRILGGIWVALGAAMMLSLIPGLIFADGGLKPILFVGSAVVIIGILLVTAAPKRGEIRLREAIFSVGAVWVSAGLIGALPYYFGGLLVFTDALFESFSGFTTTGASVVTDVEAWPHAMLFWRSMTHCLGGMGIVVMSVAILPLLGYGGVELFQTEAVGPVKDKLTPRVRETAQILWSVYLGMILVETALLWIGGMELFDALCHSFGTMATGGFSTKNASIGHYQSSYINWIIIIFMLLGGINFGLHIQALRGKPLMMWRDPELRWWLGLIFSVIVICVIINYIDFGLPLSRTIEDVVFSTISVITTTGYCIVDFDDWGFAARMIILALFFVGACTCSTGGSMKMFRWIVAVKAIRFQLRKNLHPQAIIPLRMGNRIISDDAARAIMLFIITYFLLTFISALLLMLQNIDFITAISGVAACIGNVGPGFNLAGASETYAPFPVFSKYVLMADMLLGRLEIFSLLVIFTRGFWRP
ncbi:MAG: TrkH family potassium uptake protein [Calditrichaeota bacterium]|nr:TrkH family potassium uptake protein [Calditrichota bacterium]